MRPTPRAVLTAVVCALAVGASPHAAADPARATVVDLFTGDDPVVLEIDGVAIRLSELDDSMGAQVTRTLFDLDRRLLAAVDARVIDGLFAAEAEAAGMDLDTWLGWQVDGQLAPVSRAEARQRFRQQDYPAGTRFADARPVIEAELLTQRRADRMATLIEEVQARHGVRILVEPYRLPVSADDDPALGAPGAPVTIVQFSDFQCPFCARAQATMVDLVALYPGLVRVVARDYPLPHHAEAAQMAAAAQCAAEQGAYWRFADALFAQPRGIHVPEYAALAAEHGLDARALQICVDSGRYEAEVAADVADGQRLGVTGTPTFFVNGRMVSGAQPIESFVQVIEDELRRLRP